MDKLAEEKMESLQKYIPFIDFILNIDKEKYIKFVNIKNWIISRKRKYPLSALNKFEKAITTQYKNLLLANNVNIPENITTIFAPMKLKQYVNLCSDEEEEKEKEMRNVKTKKKKNVNKPKISFQLMKDFNESDDDLEIVSIDYNKKQHQPQIKTEKKESSRKNLVKEDTTPSDIDKTSMDILNKIDQLAKDDLKQKTKTIEPIIYTYREKDFEEEKPAEVIIESEDGIIFQRRSSNNDELFKRRKDFQNDNIEENKDDNCDEVEVQNLNTPNKKQQRKDFNQKSIEIISLDSDSDREENSDDNVPSTSKAAAKRATQKINNMEIEQPAFKENVNSENDFSGGEMDLGDIIDSAFEDFGELSDDLPKTKDNYANKEAKGNGGNKDRISANKNLNTSNVPAEDLVKVISSKTDLDISTLCAALEYIKQNNNASPKNSSTGGNPAETPPPAPPPINNTITPPPHVLPHQQHPQGPGMYSFNQPNTFYPPQQLNQGHMPLLAPNYVQNNHFPNIPNGLPAPRPKANDPRIIKQLQQIKNSPLLTYNVLNPETAASIMKICQSQQLQGQSQQRPPPIAKPLKTTNTNSTSASTTYGEYLRRRKEQKMEDERLRAERKAKAEQENRKLSEIEIRSKLLSTLKPCEDKLTALWSQKKNKLNNQQQEENNSNNNNEEVGIMENETNTKESTEAGSESKEKQNKETSDTSNQNNETSDNPSQNNQSSVSKNHNKESVNPKKKSVNNKKRNVKQNKKNNVRDQRLNRIYNELKCTVKGFDQLHDYIPKSNEGTLQGNTENNENSNDMEANTAKETTNITPRPIGLRRRSSIHALSAISEQLGKQQLSDLSDNEMSQNSLSSKRHLTDTNSCTSYDSMTDDTNSSSPKRRKTIDEIIKPKKRVKPLPIIDDDDDDDDEDEVDYGNYSLIGSDEVSNGKQVIIKLKRLSPTTIRKHCKKSQEKEDNNNIRLRKKCEKPIPITTTETTNNKTKKKCNNDCQMTERNTVFCVLCSSKPSDLTNHYVGKHKTESYVSRLEWSELDDLIINTPIAKLHPKTRNIRVDRYEVYCPFCKEIQLETFMNLYYHFSSHTGEYAFQCGHCPLLKPYKPDIQSHILHSRTCRNSNVKTLYRYSTNAQCIYLHYCNICNFVQINEANVFKHLREHHDRSQNIPSNVSKCILVAMSDGPDVNESNKPATPTTTTSPALEKISIANANENITNYDNSNFVLQNPNINQEIEVKFKVDDDDILVGNEPCLEEEFLDDFSIENQLKQMHEESTLLNPSNLNTIATPMTVIHCMGDNLGSPASHSTHKPMSVKHEDMDLNEIVTGNCEINEETTQIKVQTTPIQINQFKLYEKYRNYPQNVNYLGLYKCMIDDCYYSTDCNEEFCQHITGHNAAEENSSLSSLQFLQCPYCIISPEMTMDVRQLIEHIHTQHGHMIYQCSLCCYRSCVASNVHIHQQLLHELYLNNCKIYKCSDITENLNCNKGLKPDLQELLMKYVSPICCKICNTKFYQVEGLRNHETTVHKITPNDLKIYSCIYCSLTMANISDMCYHVATKHPNEQPLIYDYNAPNNNINKDCIDIANIINISKTVDIVELNSNMNDVNMEQANVTDVKPSLQELMQMNEETIKVRLRKLTAHTGIPPDNLYRCSESTCGGFFSTFDLWLRHMKNRHHCIECKCPHCNHENTLQQFELHFEQHRRHTFICYHCSSTYNNATLAQEHFKRDHSDLGEMRLEQIRFNISYSYTIMIQSILHQERDNFMTEFLLVLDKHLNDLSSKEMENLKHHWPVKENLPWLHDYLHLLQNRKVTRNCLVNDCGFRTSNADYLYKHLQTMHAIEKNTTFNCSTCGCRLNNCHSFDVIVDHLKMHNGNIYICTVCLSISAPNRTKISAHIAEQHSARDVPIIQLFKNNNQLMIAIHIVFADNYFTFSTMKNCFCCPEKNMDGDVFILHLKRYHKFSINYYCDKCMSNLPFKSLNDVKTHFQKNHPLQKIKLRCKLAAHHDLSITSLNDFQIKILTENHIQQQKPSFMVNIKNEPVDIAENGSDDDNVIILEDDDIVIQNSLQEAKLREPKETPKLKCVSFTKLQENKAINIPTASENFQQPSTSSYNLIRIQNSGNVNTLTGAGTPISSSNSLTTNTNVLVPSTYSRILQSTTVPEVVAATNPNNSLQSPTVISSTNFQQQSTSARLLHNTNVPNVTAIRLQTNGYGTNPNISNNLNKMPGAPTTTTYYIHYNNNNTNNLKQPALANKNLTNNRILINSQNSNSAPHHPSSLNVPYNLLSSHTNAGTTTPANVPR